MAEDDWERALPGGSLPRRPDGPKPPELRETISRTTGELVSEASVTLTEDCRKLAVRWHGTEPRRVQISIGDHCVLAVDVALLPGEALVIRSMPPTDFERALERLFHGDVRVIGDDGEPG